jgi:hypothetical protein
MERWLIWLFPVVFLIHDGEEVWWAEAWVRENAAKLEERLAGLPVARPLLTWAKGNSRSRFAFIVFCLAILTVVCAYQASQGEYLLFAGAVAVLFGNVFTHLGQSIAFGGYTPGVVTAVLVALPYSAWTLHAL